MGRTAIKGSQIIDGTIQLADIDFTTTGQALVTKIKSGAGISLTSTGIDAGTGEVTVSSDSATSGALTLDQTIPQTVSNGTPLINEGIKLGTSPTSIPHTIGRVYWDILNQTVTSDLNSNMKLPLGEKDINILYNVSGINIIAGEAVYITGSNGSYNTIAKTNTNAYNTSLVFGLLGQNINNGANGYVVSRGKVENINASGSLQAETWLNSDVLYLSTTTAGALTKVAPTNDNFYKVKVGHVLNNHAVSGSIFVDIKYDKKNDFTDSFVDLGTTAVNFNINPNIGRNFHISLSTANVSMSILNPIITNRYHEVWIEIDQPVITRTVTLLLADNNIISAGGTTSSGDNLSTSTTGLRTDTFNFHWNGTKWVYVQALRNIRAV